MTGDRTPDDSWLLAAGAGLLGVAATMLFLDRFAVGLLGSLAGVAAIHVATRGTDDATG